ncbi:hypothetical protein [Microbacterium thalassium]|uniref:Uncharacterized protein n=1 Tax=Microbacterium thalassium TaxID=362649 RepID=A0A7X0KVY4_9MICO|nr:hypothetical protein [Microbacterium thalassium]MBB6392673.1 hypothetical protein [Microbacterium thalassium]GLK23096.1 hypothetical protein GCM10017607_04140 [Microbacterium thalassium]
MALVFGLSARHIDTDMLRSDEGHSVDGPGLRYRAAECPTCGIMLASSGYCDQCDRYIALA